MWIKSRLYSLVKEKNTILAIWKLLYVAAAWSCSFYTFVQIFKDRIAIVENWSNKYWWGYFVAGLIMSIFNNREQITYKKIVDGLPIEVQVNDLFHINANSYVIPTNTFFRTNFEGEYISTESVQGIFQMRYFKNEISELDKLIKQSLHEQGLIGKETKDKFGKVKRYPLGTVAKIDLNGKHYYFVAINDVNEYGKPVGQKNENIDIALNEIIGTIQKIGHCDELAMPLIGTGRAAIKGARKEDIVKKIVENFTKEPNKIVNKLIISISPKDYIDGMVNIAKIQKFLDYKQEFGDV